MPLAEADYPGWLSWLLTHVQGLDNYAQGLELLFGQEESIKCFMEVTPFD